MRDDRLTGYATENVAPLTPPDLELLGELARQLPRAAANAVLREMDADTYLRVDATIGELACPIRDCPGHEGPHGSLFGARLDECE